jgi:hypothetical protein
MRTAEDNGIISIVNCFNIQKRFVAVLCAVISGLLSKWPLSTTTFRLQESFDNDFGVGWEG